MRSWNFTENFWQFLILAAVCYFIGCFNFARFISKKKHKDITKIGSGNPGTMNMSREFGWKIGVITFFCDAFKGGLPTLAAHLIFRKFVFSGSDVCVADVARYLAALFVIIGHIFPVTNRFKGGKGIASTFGGFWFGLACENPWFLLLGFLFFVAVALYIFFYGVGFDGLADRHFRVCNLAGNDISVALRSGKKRVFRGGDVVVAAVERVHVGGAS